jgi:peptidoglycan/xylan/chitin deacetylase (PgdA/CDA1 family)
MELHGRNRRNAKIGRRLFTLASVAVALNGCGPANRSEGTGSAAASPVAPPATATAGKRPTTTPPAVRPLPDPQTQVSQTASALLPGTYGPPGPAPSRRPAPAAPAKARIVADFTGKAPGTWGLYVPGTATNLTGRGRRIALTFDCCGGPGGNGVDRELIDTLQRTRTRATFFLNFRWIQANPGVARSLAENPLFEIGNHGTKHVPLSVSGRSAYGIQGTASPAEVYDEVMVNQAALYRLTGKPARYFRPGTAYFDEASAAIVRELGLIPVSFSINGDGGATYPAPVVLGEVAAAKPGDIIIAHANHPHGGTAAGVALGLTALKTAGLKPGRLNVK